MSWLDRVRGALGLAREPLFPALLRVRTPAGRPAETVRLIGTFSPGGQRLSQTLVTASGLCMVEWPAKAEHLQVRVGAGDSFTEIEVDGRRPDPDRVIEVQLA